MRKSKVFITLALLVAGGGTLSVPAVIEAFNPAQQVSVVSFTKATSKHDLGDIKAGTKYCKVVVKHRKTGVKVPVPAPVKACGVLKKGQELSVRGTEIVSKIPGVPAKK